MNAWRKKKSRITLIGESGSSTKELFRELYRDCPEYKFQVDLPYTLFAIPDLPVVIAGLNSTMFETHEQHIGKVGEAQLRWFREKLQPYFEQGLLRIGMVHHIPNKPLREQGIFENAYERVTRRDDFLSRVEKVCRIREGAGVEIERMTGGTPPCEYLRVVARDSDCFARVYPLTGFEQGVTQENLTRFSAIHKIYCQADPGVTGLLVYAATPRLMKSSGSLAARNPVEKLRGIPGLDRFSAKGACARQNDKLARDRIYPPHLYVPQQAIYRQGLRKIARSPIRSMRSWAGCAIRMATLCWCSAISEPVKPSCCASWPAA